MTEKKSGSIRKKAPSRGGKREGAGRPKGVPNKLTTQVKEAILEAFDKAGGVDYLARQADENPTAFMTLLGKIVPNEMKAEISGNPDAPLVTRIELVPLNDNSQD